MPTYEYACRSCGNHLEVVQSFSDEPLTECPACHEDALRKVFSAIGIAFKGSGFYKTDARSGRKGAAAAGTKAAEKPEKSGKSDKTEKSATSEKSGSASKKAESGGGSTSGSSGSGEAKTA
jgi:putative FmdB family regulatory protein